MYWSDDDIKQRIREIYIDKKNGYSFENEQTTKRFLDNACVYVQDEYREKMRYKYTMEKFLYSSEVDTILYDLSVENYPWFL